MSDVYVTRSDAIAARMLGDELMIMSARDSTLFTLNDVGTAIWQAADGVTPLREIVERTICTDFDVDREQAMADAREFVDALAEKGILRVSGEPAVQG